MHLSSTLPSNNRIEIADVLRGFAVMGITLIHFIERFSLNSFPEETCNFLIFTDKSRTVCFLPSPVKPTAFSHCFLDLAFLFKTTHKNKKEKIFVVDLPGG